MEEQQGILQEEFVTPTKPSSKRNSLTPVNPDTEKNTKSKRKLFTTDEGETPSPNKKGKRKRKSDLTSNSDGEEEEDQYVASLTKTPSMTNPTEPILFDNLLMTQNVVRNKESLISLIQSFKEDKKFPNIIVFSFPDGKSFLHDGHHRVLALYLTGRDKLYADEYVVIHSTYETMSKPIFEKQFVTPYDPRIEIRLGEFGEFKKKALELSQTDEKAALEFIESNRHLYCTKRNVTTVHSLAEMLGFSPSDFTSLAT